MKNLFLLSVSVILLASVVCAQEQTAQSKVYRWDGNDPNCPHCINYKRDDLLVTSMQSGEIVLNVTLVFPTGRLDKYVAFLISFQNLHETPLMFEPRNIQMHVLGTKPSQLSPLPLEAVQNHIQDEGKWGSIFRTFLAGMLTRQSRGTIVDDEGNRASVTITSPDYEAQRNVARAERERRERNENRAFNFSDLYLKANTAFKDEVVRGFILFDKKKALGDGGFILTIPFGEFTVEMPFGKARTGKQ